MAGPTSGKFMVFVLSLLFSWECLLRADAAFTAQFTAPSLLGESRTTHFWMPGVFGAVVVPTANTGGKSESRTRSSSRGKKTILSVIDTNGDGTRPTNCSQVRCPPRLYSAVVPVQRNGTSHLALDWNPVDPGQSVGGYSANGLIQLERSPPRVKDVRRSSTTTSSTFFRGIDALVLNTTTNTSATIWYNNWEWTNGNVSLLGKGPATVSDLPPSDAIFHFLVLPPSVHLQSKNESNTISTYLAMFYGMKLNAVGFSAFIIATEDDGLSWKYRSSFDHTSQMPTTKCPSWWQLPHSPNGMCEWGPSESGLTLLPDGKSLLVVFRLAGGLNLWSATSSDSGYTWSNPTETPAWSVFPQLTALPNGAVVLVSGRPSIGMWVADGTDLPITHWQFYNLAQAHNQNGGGNMRSSLKPSWRYGDSYANANCSTSLVDAPMETKSYMSLVSLGCDGDGGGQTTTEFTGAGTKEEVETCSVVVQYDRLANGNSGPPGPDGESDKVFSMVVRIRRAP